MEKYRLQSLYMCRKCLHKKTDPRVGFFADQTRLELAASAVTGRRSNQTELLVQREAV